MSTIIGVIQKNGLISIFLKSIRAMYTTICKSLDVTLMIDDGLHNALDLAENNIECILLDKPWNRKVEANHPLIHRVQHWQEIIDNLNSK